MATVAQGPVSMTALAFKKQFEGAHTKKQSTKQAQSRVVLTDISNTGLDAIKNKKDPVLLSQKERTATNDDGFKTVFKKPSQLATSNKATCTIVSQKALPDQRTGSKDAVAERDKDDHLICREYAEEIYQYLIGQQALYQVDPDYFKSQPTVHSKMRMVLVNWLLQVHTKLELEQETLFLTVSVIDRYMSKTKIIKSELQLIGITAMLIASKYEDVNPPTISDLVYMTADTYSEDDVKELERRMLICLEYQLGETSPLLFLKRISKLAKVTPEIYVMSKFLVEVMLYDHVFLGYPPSQRAAAAYFVSLKITTTPHYWPWSASHEELCGYRSEQLKPCVTRLAQRLMRMAAQKDTKAVLGKYSSSKFLMVAKHPNLQGHVMRKIAAAQQQ